jgi:hypothetical protein
MVKKTAKPTKKKPGRGRASGPSAERARWTDAEDALVARLRGAGKTWPEVAAEVSRLGTERGPAACMQRTLYLAAQREKGTMKITPKADGRVDVDVAIAGQTIRVTTGRSIEQILAYLSAA